MKAVSDQLAKMSRGLLKYPYKPNSKVFIYIYLTDNWRAQDVVVFGGGHPVDEVVDGPRVVGLGRDPLGPEPHIVRSPLARHFPWFNLI